MNYRISDIVFEDWKIVRKIGSGASGIVYEIRKMGQGASFPAALKVMQVPQNEAIVEELRNDGMDGNTLTTWLRGVVEDLTGEIKIMISVRGFPYIVNCEDYRVVQEDGAHWDILIRMELLTSVPEYLQKYALTEADVHRMGLQLAKALELFEEKNIIHRDLKPENIFVNTYGDFKVGDFGIARACSRISGGLSKKGTENYMAPEVYRGRDYDGTVDIYSLGLVLYKLLNKNRLPFYPLDRDYTIADRQQAMSARMSGQEMAAPVMASPEMAGIVLRMCAFYPEDRYRSARELIMALEACRPSDHVVLGEEETLEEKAGPKAAAPGNEDLTGVVFYSDGFQNGSAGAGQAAAQPEDNGRTGVLFGNDWSSGISSGTGGTGAFRNTSGQGRNTGEYFGEGQNPGRGTGEYFGEGQNPGQNTGEYFGEGQNPGQGTGGRFAEGQNPGQDAEGRFDEDQSQGGDRARRSSKRSSKRSGAGKTGSSNKEGKLSKENRRKALMAAVGVAALLALLVPWFLSREFLLTVNGGDGGGSYTAGTTVSVSAEKKEGSSFTGWETAGITLSEEQSSAEELSFKMPRKKVTLTAVYETDHYQVTVNSGSGSGEYEWNAEVTVKADAPETGYEFTGWTVIAGTVSAKDLTRQEISFRIGEEDIELTASYEPMEYELIVNEAEGSQTVAYGEKIRLEAEDVAESSFTGWRIDSGEPALTEEDLQNQRIEFTMPAQDVELTAVYALNEHQVTVVGGSGSGTYKVGDTVEITADSPAEGSQFSGWKSLKGKPSLEDSSLETTSFTMPDRDVKLSAQYDMLEYTVTVNGGEGSGTYSFGDNVEITADSQSGSSFTGWTVDEGSVELLAADAAATSFVMPAQDVELTAEYAANEHQVTVENGSGSGIYKAGDTVEITANAAAAGTQFSGWKSLKGKPSLEDSSLETTSFTMPDRDVMLSAQYETLQYTVTVNDGTGSGTYSCGEEVEISANSKSSYTFSGWTVEEGDIALSDAGTASATFIMPAGDVELTAVFALNEHQATVENGSGSGTYKVGDTVEITANTPEAGYQFSGWQILKGKPSLENSSLTTTSFTMPDQDVTLSAQYEAIGYTVTVNNGNGGGTYHLGDIVYISADSQKDGMTFEKWTIDSGTLELSDLSLQNISFSMPASDVTLTAHYATTKYTVKVKNGTGSGMFAPGDSVTVTAEASSGGSTFAYWEVTSGTLDTSALDLSQRTLTFVMPENSLSLTAMYAVSQTEANTGYVLTVNGGTGSGNYAAGTTVKISHDAPAAGMEFAYWLAVGYTGTVDMTSDELEIVMPENDVIFTAVFCEQ